MDPIRAIAPLMLAAAFGCNEPPTAPQPVAATTTCGIGPVAGSALKLLGGTRLSLPGKPHAVGVSSGGVTYVGQLESHALAQATLPTFAFGTSIPLASVPPGSVPLQVAFNSSGTRAYVTNFSPTVPVIDVASGTIVSNLSVTGNASAILVAPGDTVVWVATSADSVFGIQTSSGMINHRIKIGAVVTGLELPTGLAVCDSLLYLSSDGGVLFVFDTRRDSLRKGLLVGGNPQRIVIDPNKQYVYIANGDGHLQVVDVVRDLGLNIPLSGGGFGLAQSPADGRLYVTTSDGGQVRVIDPELYGTVDSFFVGGRVRDIAFNSDGTIAVVANELGWVDFLTAPAIVPPPGPPHVLLGGEPHGAAISPSGVVYVTLLDNNRVAVATLPSFAFPTAISVGGTVGKTPTDVAFNSTGTRAYVANQFSNLGGSAGAVSVIDVAAGMEIATIPLKGWYAYAVTVAPGDSIVWVTSDSLYRIRTSTATITGVVRLLGRANDLAVRDSLIYVSMPDYNVVLEVNTRTSSVQRTFPVGGRPQGMVVSANGDVLYIANEDSTLQFWDIQNNQAQGSVPLGGPGFGLAQHPSNGRLYATTLGAGKVQVVDAVTRAKVDSFVVGGIARHIAFNASGTVAVVANESGWVDFLQN